MMLSSYLMAFSFDRAEMENIEMDGVMGDSWISCKRKGMVLTSYITTAFVYGLETKALTERQQKVQVCENNWIRRIVAVNRVDKGRIDELTEEVGVKESFKKKLVRSRLKWAGHVERMGDEKLAKRADAQKVERKEGKEDRECDGRTV